VYNIYTNNQRHIYARTPTPTVALFGPTVTPTNTPQPANTPTPTSTPTTQPLGSVYFEDDFESDQGWITNSTNSDTATTGQWERGNPEQTSYSSYTFQSDAAVSGVNTLVTGRLAGSSVGNHDIDNGITSIRSPLITLPSDSATTLSFSYYLSHWNNSTQDDFLKVKVVGNTTNTLFQQSGTNQISQGEWQTFAVSLDGLEGQAIYLLIEAADGGTPSLVEAAIDDIRIAESTFVLAALDTSAPRDEAQILTKNLYLPVISNGTAQLTIGDEPN